MASLGQHEQLSNASYPLVRYGWINKRS